MGKTRESANLVSDRIISVDIVNDRVGIGTDNPQFALDVSGDINLTGTLNQNGSQFVASRWTSGTGDDIYRLNGNVGFGTSLPLSKIDVVGDANITGVVTASSFYGDGSTLTGISAGLTITNDTSTNSTFYPTFTSSTSGTVTGANVSSTKLTFNPSTGTLTTTAIVESSSIALKENINPIENALDLLLQLNPVTYDRKDTLTKNEAGLIAEEVNKVIPNIVTKDNDGNPEGINYTKLSVYLIDAIKTLREEINSLKGK